MLYFINKSKVPSSRNCLGTMIIHDADENLWQIKKVHTGFFATIIRPTINTPSFMVIKGMKIKAHPNLYVESIDFGSFNAFLDILKGSTEIEFWHRVCGLIATRLEGDIGLTECEIPDD